MQQKIEELEAQIATLENTLGEIKLVLHSLAERETKTKDQAELNDVAESVAGEIDRETFFKVYDKAIGDGNNSEAFCNFASKIEHQIGGRNHATNEIETCSCDVVQFVLLSLFYYVGGFSLLYDKFVALLVSFLFFAFMLCCLYDFLLSVFCFLF